MDIVIFLTIVVAVIVMYLLISGLQIYLLVRKSEALVKAARPFVRNVPHAKMKILVLGDSTAYGVGAESPELTTAGRLGALYPNASLDNLAESGLRLKGLLKIIDKLPPDAQYPIILVQIGANDIIHFTNMTDVQKEAAHMFALLSKRTDTLVVLHSGDVGESEFFPFFMKPMLTQRSYALREIYQSLAVVYDARYVDLISASSSKLLSQYSDIYYASDKLHLTGAGYGLWFDAIRDMISQ